MSGSLLITSKKISETERPFTGGRKYRRHQQTVLLRCMAQYRAAFHYGKQRQEAEHLRHNLSSCVETTP